MVINKGVVEMCIKKIHYTHKKIGKLCGFGKLLGTCTHEKGKL